MITQQTHRQMTPLIWIAVNILAADMVLPGFFVSDIKWSKF